ncbi:putative glycoprotein hormone G-protein coupled receptor isoform X2 [Oculina patagonica]
MFAVFWAVLMLATLGEGERCPDKCDCNTTNVHCSKMSSFPALGGFPTNTRKLQIVQSSLATIPAGELNKLKNLSIILLDNNEIVSIQDGAFDGLDDLFEINLNHNRLTKFPSFKAKSPLKKLYLNNNYIKELSRISLNNLPELQLLELDGTDITEIPAYMFNKNKNLLSLSLQKSSLEKIDDDAFTDSNLQELFLQETKITSLPAAGLDHLEKLNLEGVENFWSIPPGLSSIHEVYVSQYNSFLCCAFYLNTYPRKVARRSNNGGDLTSTHSTIKSATKEPPNTVNSEPSTSAPVTSEVPSTATTASHNSSQHGNFSTPAVTTTSNPWGWGKRKRRDNPWPGGFETPAPTTNGSSAGITPGVTTSGSSGGGPDIPGGDGFLTATVPLQSTITHENTPNSSIPVVTEPPPKDVICLPKRDAYHPCEDIMGAKWLTVVSLMVGSVALVANLVVVVVMLSSDRRLNVHRFLMSNLAFADFCLGLYIFILVCVSMDTSGEYYNHVRAWQYGAGCKIAGFIAVFSTELSVYTLTVITIERFFAIVYAMEVNTRLSLRKAVKVMIAGWLFAFLMATLPLLGVNSYSSVAICLPFNSDTKGALAYVGVVLVLNFGTFLVIAGLYAKMFQVVVGPGPVEGAPQRNDAKVAKRMALLVFTDFVCWTPIAFFGLLAAFGTPLIGVEDSKFLLVFFFPLNSLCNPFLYAFFTKAFKREFYSLLSRFGFCHTRALHYKGTLSSLIYSRSRTKRSTIAEDDTRSKRISQISATSGNETRPGNGFLNGNVYENNQSRTPLQEYIPMKGVGNPGFGDESPVSPGNDDVFFDPTARATKAELSPTSALQNSRSGDENSDWSNQSTPQISRTPSIGSFHAIEGPLAEKRAKKQSVSFRDTPLVQIQKRDNLEAKDTSV